MKKFIICLFSLSLLISSCDKIEKGNYLIDRGNNPIDTTSQDTVLKHVILLEEFTGVKCNNCPAANARAKELQSIYGEENLILLGIHAGNLATTGEKHPKAFNTPEGDELFSFFTLFGVPVGFINRVDYPSNGIIKNENSWGTTIASEITREPVARITLNEDSYNSANLTLSVSGSVTTQPNFSGTNVKICLYLAENDIISPQTLADKTVDPNYEHDHVFRGSFTGTYGKPIDLSSGSDTFSENVVLPADAVKENCEVIAFIYDGDTYEILQATALKI